jgi:hypothetical protein
MKLWCQGKKYIVGDKKKKNRRRRKQMTEPDQANVVVAEPSGTPYVDIEGMADTEHGKKRKATDDLTKKGAKARKKKAGETAGEGSQQPKGRGKPKPGTKAESGAPAKRKKKTVIPSLDDDDSDAEEDEEERPDKTEVRPCLW